MVGMIPSRNRWTMARCCSALLLLLCLIICGAGYGLGQSTRDTLSARPGHPEDLFPGNSLDPAMQQRRMENFNKQRLKDMATQSAKLLQLATELHAELDANQSIPLTAQQLRKINEIEKLARSVKERMSLPMLMAPVFKQDMTPEFR